MYYQLDPFEHDMIGNRRKGRRLVPIPDTNGFVSPRLQIRFEVQPGRVVMYTPKGHAFQHRTERETELLNEIDFAQFTINEERMLSAEALLKFSNGAEES